jgi:hypothetical protein
MHSAKHKDFNDNLLIEPEWTVPRVSEPAQIPPKLGVLQCDVAVPEEAPTVPRIKDPAAQQLGHKGGVKRAQNMSPERRSEIARIAAKSRWDKA